MPPLLAQFMNRCEDILTKENISFEKNVLAELIMKYMPDWRRVINELQRYSVSGNIDSGILVNLSDVSIDKLINHLKLKNFRGMRHGLLIIWIVNQQLFLEKYMII